MNKLTPPPFNKANYKITYGTHKGKGVIFFHFPKSEPLLMALRNKLTVRWSATHKAWYAIDMHQYRAALDLPERDIAQQFIEAIHPVNRPALMQMHELLVLKRYSINTQRVYLSEFSQLLKLLKHHPVSKLNSERLRAYLLYCHQKLKLSENAIHSRLNALKFYFEQVLKQPAFFFEIPRPKKPQQVPKVISKSDIVRLFNAIENPKHRLALQLVYGMGLRVSEVIHLKVSDIDSKRMQVLIEGAKGKKSRYVNLPESILTDLRNYYKSYKPQKYLFEGQAGGQYTARSVQQVFKKAMNKARINKVVGVHGLRHSYATHLLESGVDTVYIKDLLGHKDLKTTMIYTKVSQKSLQNIKSPLDSL